MQKKKSLRVKDGFVSAARGPEPLISPWMNFSFTIGVLTEEEVELVEKGVFLSVEPQDKLTTIWGRLKTGR